MQSVLEPDKVRRHAATDCIELKRLQRRVTSTRGGEGATHCGTTKHGVGHDGHLRDDAGEGKEEEEEEEEEEEGGGRRRRRMTTRG